jgi:F0F1-type ATP synthase assembly protein I
MSKKDEHDVWQAAWADALRATSMGWDLGLPICGGTMLGYYLDRRLNTGHVLTIGLLVLGVIVGFYNVGRKIQQEINRDRDRSE